MDIKQLQVIYTRFAQPTNTRGSRIVASIPGKRTPVTHPIAHALSREENHREAAEKALRWKLGGEFKLIGMGDTPNEKGYAFIFERAQEI
jgi:hypothetical protein